MQPQHADAFDDSPVHPESCYCRMKALEQRCDELERLNARQQRTLDGLFDLVSLLARFEKQRQEKA